MVKEWLKDTSRIGVYCRLPLHRFAFDAGDHQIYHTAIKLLTCEGVKLKYYVYILYNPLTNLPFYVGKGKDRRLTEHERHVRNGKIPHNNYPLYQTIKSLLDAGLRPVNVKVEEDLDNVEAFALEAAWIEFIGLDNLCNIVPGGIVNNPMAGNHHTEESIKKIRETNSTPEARARSVYNAVKWNTDQCLKKYGGFAGWFTHPRNKWITEQEKQDRRELRDIQRVIQQEKRKAERIKWIAEHELHKYDYLFQLGAVTINHEQKIFIRRCPNCNGDVKHKTWDSLKSALYHKPQHRCRKCPDYAFRVGQRSKPAL